jgi:3-oxoadipate enol-lactonase
MPQLRINNINLYYEQHGSGPDLILIGGLTSDHQVWKSTVRLLSSHFRILIFDNRGAGQTDAPDYPYTIDMMAQDTVELMNALQIKRAHILGHSMGGAIAQQIALTSPEKIDKLILMCTRAKISAIGNLLFSMREKLQAMHMTDDLLAEYVMPFLFSETFLENKMNVKGFAQWTLHNPYPQTAVGFKNQFYASKSRDFTDQLHKIALQTLVIAGTEDILVPLQYAQQFTNSLKNAVLVTIADCAHLPHVEKSAEFVACILRFLSHSP